MNIENINYKYKENFALKDISFSLKTGMNIIIGPNASGKTTLLKCLAGILTPSGKITFENKTLSEYPDIYEFLSYFPQSNQNSFSLSVLEMIMLGLIKKLKWKINTDTLEKIEKIMSEMQILDLASKQINELSGGQQQIVYIAQSLIKDPKILLMDEPTNNLDLKNQVEIMETIKKITKKNNMYTLIALHDINLASRYADNLIVINHGMIYKEGKPKNIITSEMVKDVYGIEPDIVTKNDIKYIMPK